MEEQQEYTVLAPGARGRLAGVIQAAPGVTRFRFEFTDYTLESACPPRLAAWVLAALLGNPDVAPGPNTVRVSLCHTSQQFTELAHWQAGPLVGLLLGLASYHRQQARRARRAAVRQQRAFDTATVLALSIHNLLPNG